MKKQKPKTHPFRKLGIAAFIAFLAGIGAVELVRSDWAKGKARDLLARTLEDSGFQMEIGKIEGSLPSHIVLEGVSLRRDGFSLSVDRLEARLSLLRLLKRELAFTVLDAEGVAWKYEIAESGETAKEPAPPMGYPKLPLAIYVEQFHLKEVQVPDFGPCDFSGKFRLGKTKAFLNVKAKRQGFPDSTARLMAVVKRDGDVQLRAFLKTPTLQVLRPPSSPLPFDAAVSLEAIAAGPLASLRGRISGSVVPDVSNAPELLRDWLHPAWTLSAYFTKQEALSFPKIAANNERLNLKGQLALDPALQFSQANVQIVSELAPEEFPFTWSGRFLSHVRLTREEGFLKATAAWKIPALRVQAMALNQVQGSSEAVWQEEHWEGTARLAFQLQSQPFQAESQFAWAPGQSLFLRQASLTAPGLSGIGDLEIRPDQLLAGTTELSADNFQAIPLSLPPFHGKLAAKAEWKPLVEPDLSLQGVYLDASLSNFHWGSLTARKASLYSDLLDPFHAAKGNLDLSFEQLQWGSLRLSAASFETSNVEKQAPFRLLAEGTWKHPLSVEADGTWEYEDKHFAAHLQNLAGSFSNHPIVLKNPVDIAASPDSFLLPPLEIQISDASLSVFARREEDNSEAGLSAANLPLDFLSLNPLDLPLAGSLNLDARMREQNNRLQGELTASVAGFEVDAVSAPGKLNASGTFEGKFDRDRLDLQGNLQARDQKLLDLELSLPVRVSVWPFQADILPYKKAQGRLAFNGRIEDLLDFFDLGAHRLEGNCVCDFRLSNTLNRPSLSGSCRLTDGLYQNYYTGTELYNLQAEWEADKERLLLKSLTAQDAPKKGTFTAQGEIALRADDLFPFRFDAAFSRLNFVQIDLVSAEADGRILIEGNRKSALAKGAIEIVESELSIPDHIPRQLPELKVVYLNPIHPPSENPPEYKPYPLFLDLHVSTPENILIAGRGLHSIWTGDFDIGGAYSAITAKGKLELISGEFAFSGRTFKLSEGALSFSGKEHEMPQLDLSGSLDQKGIKIIANLKGPLNNPQVTLQSIPPLPLNSLMSYLLFGQNIGEISGFQALQLATSVASLAGQGPDIMESTRRALGVDRLRIISTPSEDGDTIALEVGTYLTEGILVSFSQGAEDSSSNISVEVEIRDNFSFQAETQQQTEQGKFSFKWYLNY